MCSLVGMGIGAAGALTSAIGAGRQQSAANQAAEYNARMSEYNAKVEKRQAAEALRRGREAEARHRINVAQLSGTQSARAASAGVDVSSGSALDAMLDTAAWGEYDALAIRENAAHEAHAHRVQQAIHKQQAAMTRSTKASPFAAFGTSLLGSASPLLQQYDSWSQRLRKT